METITKFLSGFIGGGAVSGLLLFVFKGQNKRIDKQDLKIYAMGEKKTDKSLCKTIHMNLDKTLTEIKTDISYIKEHMTEQLVSTAKIEACLAEVKRSIDKK